MIHLLCDIPFRNSCSTNDISLGRKILHSLRAFQNKQQGAVEFEGLCTIARINQTTKTSRWFRVNNNSINNQSCHVWNHALVEMYIHCWKMEPQSQNQTLALNVCVGVCVQIYSKKRSLKKCTFSACVHFFISHCLLGGTQMQYC